MQRYIFFLTHSLTGLFYVANGAIAGMYSRLYQTSKTFFGKKIMILNPTKTPHVFWVETMWKRSFDVFSTRDKPTHIHRLTIDWTSKFHAQHLSIFHRLWKANPRRKADINSTWVISIRLPRSFFNVVSMLNHYNVWTPSWTVIFPALATYLS